MTRPPARTRRSRAWQKLALLAFVGPLLAGCPLTDHYYIDDTLGGGATTASGGAAASAGKAMGGSEGPDHDCLPEPELCDGVSNDCDADVDEDDVCPPGCSAAQHDGHVYLLCVATSAAAYVTHLAAGMRCDSAGSELGLDVHFNLASIESAGEEAFLKDWIATVAPPSASVWHAANDLTKEGTWVWGEGPQATPFLHSGPMGGGMPDPGKYADFAPGHPSSTQPDTDCGAFDGSLDWQWDDERCLTPAAGYVCEQKP
jgi:hypothetical protein